jgi:hypothetical protein
LAVGLGVRKDRRKAKGKKLKNPGTIAERPTGKTRGAGALGTMTTKGAGTSPWRIQRTFFVSEIRLNKMGI